MPRDTTTGRSERRRINQPLTIVKELDSASIQFFQAFRNGAASGAMRPYSKVTLTNPAIVDYKDAGDGVKRSRIGLVGQGRRFSPSPMTR